MTHSLYLALAIAVSPQPPVSVFADVSVTAATDAAVATAPQVESARAHVAEMRALLDAEGRSGAPELTAAHVDAPQGGPNGGTIDQSLTTLGGTYSFTDAFDRGPAVAEARASLLVAGSDLKESERLERVKAIDNYYDALHLEAEVRVRRSFVEGARRDLAGARQRFVAGAAPRLDIVRAQVDVSRAEAALDAANVAADNALDALSAETGIDRGRFIAVAPVGVAALPPGNDAALVQVALAHRADLAAARDAVGVERAAVQVAQRAGAPNVTVSAGYTQGVDAGIFVRGPSAALQLGLPLGRTSRAKVDAQLERVRQAELRVAQLERDIRLEVTAALRTARAATRAVRASASAQGAADDEQRAVLIGYASGASSSLDVAEARRVDAEAVVAALEARYEEARSHAQLFEVIGS